MEPSQLANKNLKVLASVPRTKESQQEQNLQQHEAVALEHAPDQAKNGTGLSGSKQSKTPFKRIIGMIALTVALATTGHYAQGAYQHVTTHEETDDAYITGHLHQVSTRVNGTVDRVLVDDNEHVKKGQVLVLLDPRDYKAKVDQALANLDQAERQAKTAQTTIAFQDTTATGQDINAKGSVDTALAAISRSKAAVREAQAGISAAQANLAAKQAEVERATADYKRYDYLAREGAISLSAGDSARRDYLVALQSCNAAKEAIIQANERFQQAQESVRTSQADLTKAQAQVQLAKASAVQSSVRRNEFETDLSAVAAAKAALTEAQLNLSYTNIVAPTDGRIGKKTVEEGQRIEPGQPLLTIVSDAPWVVANYKETQLKRMHEGQTVDIKIDSFPDHKFEGKVLSFSPASGTSFAILPSDNATGNFTKIVQRVPVKILFTPASLKGYETRVTPGLSAITSVDVNN